ncbi:MAG: bifunctional folylpolyglutamate synthase/dihydrofolate synthase [Treponema sp.]
MKLSDFLKWLDGFLNFEKTQTKNIFWLDTMRFLCARLGNPQDSIKCIHVAGSKGKGSVCAMSASIIESAGYSCGLYMSPHIVDFRERVTTPHGFFDDSIYESAAKELYETVCEIPKDELPGGRRFTWFELVTAFAFLCFRNAKVDFAVYETGLGGRLDSTNVVTPLVSVLMPIELEHTEFLGGSIEKIAAEKAGIIKDGVPAVIARQITSESDKVFFDSAKYHNSKTVFVERAIKDFSYSYKEGKMLVSFATDLFDEGHISVSTKLLGAKQAENAATAAIAVKTAIPSLTENHLQKGLAAVYLPARFESIPVPKNYKHVRGIIIDGAHTAASIKYTLSTLKEIFGGSKKFHLLFACAKDKDVKSIAKEVRGAFTNIIVTESNTNRAFPAGGLKNIFTESGVNCSFENDLHKALLASLKNASGEEAILLITGSFYLAADVIRILNRL